MADLDPTTTDPTDAERPPGMPRWVKVFVIIAALVIALVIVVAVAGGGSHGPQRHGARTLIEHAVVSS